MTRKPKTPDAAPDTPALPAAPELLPESPPKLADHRVTTLRTEVLLQSATRSGPQVRNHPAEPTPAFVRVVKRLGILQAVVVAQRAEGRYEVRDGIRRIKAAQEAGFATVPVRLYSDLRGTAGAAATLAANLHRSANPVEELRAIEDLLEAAGSEKVVAQALGVPLGTVRRRLKLRALLKPLRQAFDRGHVTLGAAELAAGLAPAAQRRLADSLKEEPRLTLKRVRKELTVATAAVSAGLPDALFPDAAEQLERSAPPPIRLTDAGMQGAVRAVMVHALAQAFEAGRADAARRWENGADYARTQVRHFVEAT